MSSRASHRRGARLSLLGSVAAFFLDLLLSIALLTGLSLLGAMIWGVVQGWRGADSAQIAPDLSVSVAIGLFSTAIAALIVYYFRRNANALERAESWRSLWRWRSWGWIVLAVIVCTVYSAAIGKFAQYAHIEITPTNTVLGELLRLYPRSLLIFAVLIAPAYEELLFRRVLFGRLWAAGRPWLGVALSSVAFAFVHEPPGLGVSHGWGMLLLWSVYGLMGASFAWIYYRSGSLWTAYFAHAGNNLIACLTLLA